MEDWRLVLDVLGTSFCLFLFYFLLLLSRRIRHGNFCGNFFSTGSDRFSGLPMPSHFSGLSLSLRFKDGLSRNFTEGVAPERGWALKKKIFFFSSGSSSLSIVLFGGFEPAFFFFFFWLIPPEGSSQLHWTQIFSFDVIVFLLKSKTI